MIPHKDGMTLFELMVVRVLESLIEKPNSGLLNEVLDRLEGRSIYPIQVSPYEQNIDALDGMTTEKLRGFIRDIEKIARPCSDNFQS